MYNKIYNNIIQYREETDTAFFLFKGTMKNG